MQPIGIHHGQCESFRNFKGRLCPFTYQVNKAGATNYNLHMQER
jgi:hypothetical protein